MSIYGSIISLAILVCALLGEKRATLDRRDLKLYWNVVFLSVVLGIVGARIYHVIDLWKYYSIDPIKILYFWNGGLGIWGGIIGAFIGVTVYLTYIAGDRMYWLDLLASVLPLGQALGRWGNFFNQENFGFPTTLPWGVSIATQNRPQQFNQFEKFHPLFLYESLLNLILFFILSKYKRGSGMIAVLYLLGYSLIRFFLEFLRVDPWKIYGINVAQFVCLAVSTVTLIYAIHLIGPRGFRTKK